MVRRMPMVILTVLLIIGIVQLLWLIKLRSCKVIFESLVSIDNSELHLFNISFMMIKYSVTTNANIHNYIVNIYINAS